MSDDTEKRDTWDAIVGMLFFVEKTGCPPTREGDILETRPSMCCFFVERTGCPPTRKSDILETRPSVCCFLSKNRMSADTEIYNQTRLTGCPLTRKGEILETRPSVCCFLSKERDVRRHGKATYLRRDRRCVVFISKKRDVRRHGKATYLRRDRGESDLENAKNRVLLCLLACCCLNKVFEHFRGRKI